MLKYLIFLLLSASISAESLYFIDQSPRKNDSPLGPHSCIIWQFDEENKKLEKIWEPKENEWTNSIMLYQRLNIILIEITSFYSYNDPDKFYLIPCDSLDNIIKYSTNRDSLINDLRVYELENSEVAVLINYNQPLLIKDNMLQNIVRLNEPKASARKFGTTIHGQEYSQVQINKDGSLRVYDYYTPNNLHFSLQTNVIPDGLFRLNKDKKGTWIIASNEPEYIIIQSGKYLEENFREVLLFKKDQNKWYSFLIPGLKTNVRLINNWITAIENGSDSLKSYQFCTFINIKTLEQYYVRLGQYATVLWIEDSGIVYYKYKKGIYKGVLNSGLLENRELILKSPSVTGIGWGFRGK